MSPIREHSAGVIAFLGKTGPDGRWYLLIHSARVLNPRARWFRADSNRQTDIEEIDDDE
jgi:hypothetical protein